MATSSLKKDFVIEKKETYEKLKKDIERKCSQNRTVSSSESLERGKESLKHFSFH